MLNLIAAHFLEMFDWDVETLTQLVQLQIAMIGVL